MFNGTIHRKQYAWPIQPEHPGLFLTVLNVTISACLITCALLLAFSVIPAQSRLSQRMDARDAADAKRAAEEAEHQKEMDAARKKAVVEQARLLMLQQEAIRQLEDARKGKNGN